MNELIIERLDYLKAHQIYLTDCKIISGNILPNEVWHLQTNPNIKITFKSPAIFTNSNFKEDKLVYYAIFKPEFDLELFNQPTAWVKE